ncbi:hypothetical protein B0H13DRAFT_2278706, partial [Mycena leptocephala]
MLYKVISTAILLLALAQGIASTPSLAPRIACGPDVRELRIAVAPVAWRGSPTFVVTSRMGGEETFRSDGLMISRSSDHCLSAAVHFPLPFCLFSDHLSRRASWQNP